MVSLAYPEELNTVDSFIFVGYAFCVDIVVAGDPRNQIFKEYYIFPIVLYADFGKPRKQISTKMVIFLNPRNLVPTKITGSTVNEP